jgi:dipeptidyl aminopeptidase/acylaminoacyl peptidase
VQSSNDRLVPPDQTEAIAATYRDFGCDCTIHTFPGEGEAHGIWRPTPFAVPDLLEPIETAILAFLERCFR